MTDADAAHSECDPYPPELGCYRLRSSAQPCVVTVERIVGWLVVGTVSTPIDGPTRRYWTPDQWRQARPERIEDPVDG